MPIVGDIKRAGDIWPEITYPSMKHIYHACEGCGKERWVQYKHGKSISVRCYKCAMNTEERRAWLASRPRGPESPHWKNGRQRQNDGYVLVWMDANDFFFPMADHRGYVLEHRLIMARYLGRCLQSWEIVHHKDGVRDNNNLDNLELTTQGGHLMETKNSIQNAYNEGFQDGLKVRDDDLRKEIRLLRWQLNELINTHRLLENT